MELWLYRRQRFSREVQAVSRRMRCRKRVEKQDEPQDPSVTSNKEQRRKKHKTEIMILSCNASRYSFICWHSQTDPAKVGFI